MTIDDEKWGEIRQAVEDDDQGRFRALIRLVVSEAVSEHNDVVNRPRPALVDGRRYFAFDR